MNRCRRTLRVIAPRTATLTGYGAECARPCWFRANESVRASGNDCADIRFLNHEALRIGLAPAPDRLVQKTHWLAARRLQPILVVNLRT
jgi:hypothetical protein